jgi:site-specific DNA-methyltransferase (adenine-specific)
MELELITDDVLRALPLVPSESVDVVMTSPDYNLGVKYKASQKVKQLQDYLAWATAWGREVMRVLKPGGSFFLNIAGAPARPLLPFQVLLAFSEFAVLQNTFHWIKAITIHKEGLFDKKGQPIDPRLSVGHFKPLSTGRYVNDLHEYVFHFSRDGKAKLDRKAIGVPYADKSNIERWDGAEKSDIRCRGNTWYVPYKTIQSRNKQRPHPATFPPELAELAFRIAGVNQASTVMDIFVGLGNSGIGASRIPAGKFIGIDMEPYYIEESQKRIIV